MNRRSFYATVRSSLFQGRLSADQVEGMEALLDELDNRPGFDKRWISYILATAFHETAFTMQPIREYGRGKGRKYGEPDPQTGQVYYGRGFVQLTWKANYRKMGDKLGVDLVEQPDRAMELDIATKICFDGMIDGDFTGRKLANYFSASASDWTNARRIINGADRAVTIGNYGKMFYAAILAATREEMAVLTPDPMPDPESLAAEAALAWGEVEVEVGPQAEEAAIVAGYLARAGA